MKFIEKNIAVSARDIAKKFNTSKSNVQQIKKINNIKTYKKQKCAKRTKKQQNTAITRSRKLYEKLCQLSESCVVMDDESYFKYDFSTLAGPQFYNARDKDSVPDADKLIFIEKFGRKVLVWQAICQCGKRSRPLFFEGSINTDVYVNQCMKKGLLPFLKSHNKSTLFWPDLATCHYAGKTLSWYRENNVNFLEKAINPPNVPQLRPIERYWALVKNILRKKGKSATTLQNFSNLWKSASRKVTDRTVQKLMAPIKRKVRLFSRKKLISV